jgi:hypothetical protein
MLGRLFNTGDAFWLTMQAEYDRYMAPQTVIDSRVIPADAPSRPASVGQGAPVRRLAKPVPMQGSCPTPNELSASEFPAPDVASWGRRVQGNGRSGIG